MLTYTGIFSHMYFSSFLVNRTTADQIAQIILNFGQRNIKKDEVMKNLSTYLRIKVEYFPIL